ncbi:hypothetical protein HJC23_013951 [Cyclotella cryptica]|uniref:CobW C-terminal domain-containing protein n=1 Tax=Cyclotella cryptica TaxID=29204 RepID=A0ABD3Q2I4_9STRA|eukprot:CCRYP_009204-RA/>CCRYP_009204-RA protein AED:0.24 eAED:0.24 QI:0/-1/0/1/-1/1/1/0/532
MSHLDPPTNNSNDEDDDDDEIPILFDLDSNTNHNNNTTPQPINTSPSQQHSSTLPAVPVTILTGFLGSGKTTLLRNILTSKQHHKRIAVIENEFGGGEISSDLMKQAGMAGRDDDDDGRNKFLSVETMIATDGTDGSNLMDLIELSNGCVCCTVKDSLVATLEKLLSKRSDLDYIIIEASGMADPGPVASIFWLDEALESRLRLDGIVALVDAKNILFQLEFTSSVQGVEGERDGTGFHGDEAARQIAFADRIIVNKIDLLESSTQLEQSDTGTGTTIQHVLDAITCINPTAPILTTTYSTMENLNWVLDTECFNPERVQEVEATYDQLVHGQCKHIQCGGCTSQQYCGLCNNTDNRSHFPSHHHTSAISTIALFNIGSVDLHRLNSWLASILWPNQDEMESVLRARLERQQQLEENTEVHVRKEVTSNAQGSGTQQYIYRIKGILSVVHSSISEASTWEEKEADYIICPETRLDRRRYIVQAVNDLWDVTPASDQLCWKDGDTRCCKVVVIGKWLDEETLAREFEECFCTA